jgi:hypothetical protein
MVVVISIHFETARLVIFADVAAFVPRSFPKQTGQSAAYWDYFGGSNKQIAVFQHQMSEVALLNAAVGYSEIGPQRLKELFHQDYRSYGRDSSFWERHPFYKRVNRLGPSE